MIKKLRRPLGKLKRAIKRKLYERNIGKQYKAWLEQASHTTPGSLDYAITISILVPVYNPPLPFLQECLQSVLNQESRNWELIITNDGSTNQEVNTYLDQFKKQNEKHTRQNDSNNYFPHFVLIVMNIIFLIKQKKLLVHPPLQIP